MAGRHGGMKVLQSLLVALLHEEGQQQQQQGHHKQDSQVDRHRTALAQALEGLLFGPLLFRLLDWLLNLRLLGGGLRFFRVQCSASLPAARVSSARIRASRSSWS